ncbi:Gmad2 immunoglobulin-like domain-containing protein [Pengzhenrongella frigida]|uniref:Bacterial spore germination immunoglobulin-like domain-containing protein n=1 Tax=Pengzhenrongella frigida TaxID=1259133 RepID=A0A4Q5N348_9MICO|nr:Gmad2 immunoglobulin-like domain-containing protein [Cellulomonas sp. HLT2-17]RYV52565.1 hypothetical protein EUA98_02345 [Cellulomonas sp. HLT2-17]
MTRSTNPLRASLRPVRSAGPGRVIAVATLAVAAALTLGGCADADTTPSASTEATESPSATPSSTPTTSPEAEPAETPATDETGTTTIATPADGSTVAGPQVEVTGAGTAFEGTLTWRVLAAGTDDVVTENFTTGGANGTIGPFAFTVELAPGSYTLEIWEPDMSDGEGDGVDDAPRGLATTTFTVS